MSDTRAFEWACVSPPEVPPLVQAKMLVVTNRSLTLDALAQAPLANPLDPHFGGRCVPKSFPVAPQKARRTAHTTLGPRQAVSGLAPCTAD